MSPLMIRNFLSSGKPRWRDDRGATIVEFALASILFFMVIFGIVNFGLAIWQYNLVSNVAQEGARWASVRSSASGTAGGPATAGNVQSYVEGRWVGIYPLTQVTTTWPGGNTPGQPVTVSVQTIFSPFTGLVPQANLTLSSSATMIIAR